MATEASPYGSALDMAAQLERGEVSAVDLVDGSDLCVEPKWRIGSRIRIT
jgi:hypothetical protein